MPAAGAFVEVTAESGGATPRNGPQHFDMLPADPPSASIDEDVSRSADEIGNFEDGPIHLLVLQYQLVEMGHGNLPVTYTYTSNEGHPMLRSAHAKRSPPGGYVRNWLTRSNWKFHKVCIMKLSQFRGSLQTVGEGTCLRSSSALDATFGRNQKLGESCWLIWLNISQVHANNMRAPIGMPPWNKLEASSKLRCIP
jgi:hypothetical protein